MTNYFGIRFLSRNRFDALLEFYFVVLESTILDNERG